MSEPKTKRYNGRAYNVEINLFFENYMENVSKGTLILKSVVKVNFSLIEILVKKNILCYLPAGFVSRSKASREFGLSRKVLNKIF